MKFIKNNLNTIVIMLMIVCSVIYNHIELNTVTNNTTETINDKLTTMTNNIMLRVNNHALEIQGVKRIIDSSRKIDSHLSYKYAEHIVSTANKYDHISVSLLTSILFHESRFKPFAESIAGALGMGQHIPETITMVCMAWRETCTDSSIFDYKFSIEATAWYLDYLYKIPKNSKGNIQTVVAYYNGGYRQAHRWGLRMKYEQGMTLDSLEMKLKDCMYDETEDYIINVMHKDSVFKNLIEQELPTNS